MRLHVTLLVLTGLVACGADGAAWKRAQEANSADGYATFLAEHPASAHARDARAQLLAHHVDAAIAGQQAAIPEAQRAAFRETAHIPGDASAETRQAMLLSLANLVASWPAVARQTIVELKPERPAPGTIKVGSLLQFQGETLVRKMEERHDVVAHMSVKSSVKEDGEQLYLLMTPLPHERTLLNMQAIDLATVSVKAATVLPVGTGSILTFYGAVPGFLPGWTIASAGDELPISFVWLDAGLTYLAGKGSATGPGGKSYHFDSVLEVAPTS